MIRMAEVEALAGVGLRGDRYATGAGYYSPRDVCEVTLIEGEVLDLIECEHGIRIHEGQHRRNLVTRGLMLRALKGRRLRIGGVLLEYERPRPPCDYVERLTQPGMTRALGKGSGIGVRVLESGTLREGDRIQVLEDDPQPQRWLP